MAPRDRPAGAGSRAASVVIAGTVGIALVLVLGSCGGASAGAHDVGGCPTGNDCAYVLNRSGIIPIGLRRYRVGTPIEPSGPEVLSIAPLAVAPTGRTAYTVVSSGISRSTALAPIDLVTGKVGRPISVHGGFPEAVALGPSGHTLYAMVTPGHGDTFLLEKIGLAAGKVEKSITVPNGSPTLAIAPDGRVAYVGLNGGAEVVPVDLQSGTLGSPIVVPKGVHALAVTPDGHMAYAAGNSNEAVGTRASDLREYSFVTPIDLVTGVAEPPIRLTHGPQDIVLSRDGRIAYVTGGVGPPARPAVMVIDLTSGTVERTVSLAQGAISIAIAGSG